MACEKCWPSLIREIQIKTTVTGLFTPLKQPPPKKKIASVCQDVEKFETLCIVKECKMMQPLQKTV